MIVERYYLIINKDDFHNVSEDIYIVENRSFTYMD